MYERQFTFVVGRDLISRTAELKHYADGPLLLVNCCKFSSTADYQKLVVRKNLSGWHSVETSTFCLMNPKLDISAYVSECTEYAIDAACKRGDVASTFFRVASEYRDVSTLFAFSLLQANLKGIGYTALL